MPELAWIRLNSPQYIYHIIPVNAKLGSHMHLTRQVLQLAPQKHTGDHLVRFCPAMRPDLGLKPKPVPAATLKTIEAWLTASPFLCGDKPTLADIST